MKKMLLVAAVSAALLSRNTEAGWNNEYKQLVNACKDDLLQLTDKSEHGTGCTMYDPVTNKYCSSCKETCIDKIERFFSRWFGDDGIAAIAKIVTLEDKDRNDALIKFLRESYFQNSFSNTEHCSNAHQKRILDRIDGITPCAPLFSEGTYDLLYEYTPFKPLYQRKIKPYGISQSP